MRARGNGFPLVPVKAGTRSQHRADRTRAVRRPAIAHKPWQLAREVNQLHLRGMGGHRLQEAALCRRPALFRAGDARCLPMIKCAGQSGKWEDAVVRLTVSIAAATIIASLASGPADAAQRGQVRAQLMYTVGHINSGSHRPSNLTVKRGIVRHGHPDFIWLPRTRGSR